MRDTLEELREQILTEFKQVYKLAPADYTENCTNVVMSMVSEAVNKALILELEETVMAQGAHPEDRSYGNGAFFYVPVDEIKARIAELNRDETPKQVEGTE